MREPGGVGSSSAGAVLARSTGMQRVIQTKALHGPRRIPLAPTLPREHGAWFVIASSSLLGPVVTGRLTLGHAVVLAVGWLALIGRSTLRGHRVADRPWSAFTLGFALTLGVALVWRAASPLLYGATVAAVLLAVAHTWLVGRNGHHDLGAEVVGMALLTTAAPASLALSGLGAEPATLGLMAAQSLFNMATIPFVRLCVFGAKDAALYRALRYDALILAALGAIGVALAVAPAAALAFAMPLVRGALLAARPPRRLESVQRVGWMEVLSTALFLVILGAVV